MIKKFYFLTTLLSIAASRQCHAMKNNLLVNNNDVPIQQATILAKITAVKRPYTALYLTPHHALIDGENECSTVNVKTNEKIKNISDKYGSQIAVHPNLKKFAFCSNPTYKKQNVTIYDAIIYKAEYTITCDDHIRSFHFSPLDNTIAICLDDSPNVILWNYEANTKTFINNIQNQIPCDPIISFHPKNPLMYLACEQNICTFNTTTLSTAKLVIEPEQNFHNFLECSPNGLFIARGTQKKIIITNVDTLSNRTLIDESYTPDSFITNIAIHTNSKILTTLSQSVSLSKTLSSLRYWNINRSELISTTTVPSDPDKWGPSSLSICPNGTKLLLVLNTECMEIEIPFEARYKDITKNAGVFACFALQHYLHNGTDQLSADIRNLLITVLLKTSEY